MATDPTLLSNPNDGQTDATAAAAPTSTTTTPAPAAREAPAATPAVQPADNSLMSRAAQQQAANSNTPTISPNLGFDESKSTAARVNDITKDGSPLMQSSFTAGTDVAASRGLTNTTLGGQAAQQAVIQAAVPIASNDASLYAQAKTTAAQLTESGRQANNSLQMQIDQLDAQKDQFAKQLGMTAQDLDLRRDTLNEQQRQQLDNMNLQRSQLAANQQNFGQELAQRGQQFADTQKQQLVMQSLDQQNKVQLAGIEAQYKLAIQNNTNISQAWGTMINSISTLQNNKDLDANTKATLIQNQLESFAAFSNFWQKQSGGTVDVTDLLNFKESNAGGATTGGGATPAPSPTIPDTGGGGDSGGGS